VQNGQTPLWQAICHKHINVRSHPTEERVVSWSSSISKCHTVSSKKRSRLCKTKRLARMLIISTQPEDQLGRVRTETQLHHAFAGIQPTWPAIGMIVLSTRNAKRENQHKGVNKNNKNHAGKTP